MDMTSPLSLYNFYPMTEKFMAKPKPSPEIMKGYQNQK